MPDRIESLPRHDASTVPPQLSGDEASKLILGAAYAAEDIGVDATDLMALSEGAMVAVEAHEWVPSTFRIAPGHLDG